MNIRKVLRLTHRELTASPMVPAVLVFLTFLVLIASGWRTAYVDIDNTRDRLVGERAILNENNVLQQVHSYENALLAARGLMLSSDEVNREEWTSFVGALRLGERRRGMLGLGYAEFVAADNLDRYERTVRADGATGFRIWPKEPRRDAYTTIKYIEPFNNINRSALGYDMYSEPTRRKAMDRAAETGQPAMTSKLLLVQGGENRMVGLNLYQALYREGVPLETEEQRRAAVKGFVYAPFITEQLFSSVFEERDQRYNVRVYDGLEANPDNLLYAQHESDHGYSWVRTDTVGVAGAHWTFEFGISDTAIPKAIRDRPRNVLGGGLILAFGVATLVYLLLQRRMKSLAEKEERRVQKAKDSMLSLASHQLRTPATGVKQYVGMVLEGFTGDLSPEQQAMLQKAYDSNERQLRIINEFLYLAKTEADRIIVTPQRFELRPLVQDVLDTMQDEIREAGHTVRLMSPKRRVYVAADIHSTRMIIENLISNAVKYTPPGGKIDITIKDKRGEVQVVVKDSGVGIAEKDFPKLFRQFSRIPNELTKQTPGSGIGLYLACQLAIRNKGSITVASEQGKGSEFTLHLTAKTVRNFTENQ